MDKTAQDIAFTVALKQRFFSDLQKEAVDVHGVASKAKGFFQKGLGLADDVAKQTKPKTPPKAPSKASTSSSAAKSTNSSAPKASPTATGETKRVQEMTPEEVKKLLIEQSKPKPSAASSTATEAKKSLKGLSGKQKAIIGGGAGLAAAGGVGAGLAASGGKKEKGK